MTPSYETEYVNLAKKYLLEDSVEQQFKAFKQGYQLICDIRAIKVKPSPTSRFCSEILSNHSNQPPPLQLFSAEEMPLLINGEDTFDFIELEKTTKYDNGYGHHHPTIKMFWEIVHGFSLDMKKKFLAFTTGSDRSPLGGLGNLGLIIAKQGTSDTENLPTSHTCYNCLMLPPYTSKEKLKQKLETAVKNSTGFGMV